MENTYYNVLLGLLLTVLTVNASAQPEVMQTKVLQGIWRMEAERMVIDIKQADPGAFDSLPTTRQERLLHSFGSRVFEFNGNGNFSARWEAAGKVQSAQGSWQLSDNGMLSIVLPTGTSAYTLSFPTAERMMLEPTERVGGIARRLHFIKPKKP